MKTISNFLLYIGNPILLVIFFILLYNGYWYISIIISPFFLLIFNFHLYTYKEEYLEQERIWNEFESTHTFIDTDEDGAQNWKNNETGIIIKT